jgi:uncharacterized protein (DUF2267 family)
MNWTGLDIFDSSIRRTNAWTKEFMQEMNWTERRQAILAFCDVLRAVRDHLSTNSAVELGNQLPLLIRGAYFEGWQPSEVPRTWVAPEDDAVVKAAFRLLQRKADEGEIQSIEKLLPEDLHQFWPPELRAA